MSTREARVLAFEGSEIRLATGARGQRTLVSTAPPWSTLSVPMRMPNGRGVFREQFTRGAFDLAGRDVIASFEHDSKLLLGRTPRTLFLTDTPAGLKYEISLGDTTIAKDLIEHVQRGDVRGSSFEFSLRGDGDTWQEMEDGWLRTVHAANYYQCGPVVSPAYTSGTEAALRSLETFQRSRRRSSVYVSSGRPRLDRARRQLRLADAETPIATPRLDRARRRLRTEQLEVLPPASTPRLDEARRRLRVEEIDMRNFRHNRKAKKVTQRTDKDRRRLLAVAKIESDRELVRAGITHHPIIAPTRRQRLAMAEIELGLDLQRAEEKRRRSFAQAMERAGAYRHNLGGGR